VPADPRLKLYLQKWRWYERNSLPWRRARIHLHMLRREAFVRWPIQGNVLEALDDGRLEVGPHTLFEPQCWITIAPEGRVRIGAGCFLNVNVMLAAQHEVEIDDHTMLANGCFVSDASHRFDDLAVPVPWQGFTSKGPTRVGSNCWLGAHVVVTSGVTIGDRCVVGANSVVTRDLSPGTIAAGVPARPLRSIEYGSEGAPAAGAEVAGG
jgi:acetyltransferase-like isoleucine patch superfamily enzyme